MIRSGTHLRPSSQGPEPAEGVAGGTQNSPAARKAWLRRELRARRKSLSPARARQAAQRAAAHLLRALPRVGTVGVYLASGSELDTAPLIHWLHRLRRRIVVPGLDARRNGWMRFVPLAPTAALRRRHFGIREPAVRRHPPARIDVLVLPLVGFDARGTRLGSGAGYYDRWLSRQRPRPLCIGYAFAVQEHPDLPREPWDHPLDAICTERGLRRFAPR